MSMMRMKNWSWRTLGVIALIAFLSCAGQPPATRPDEPSREMPPDAPTSSREMPPDAPKFSQESPEAQSDRRGAELSRAAAALPSAESMPPAKNITDIQPIDLGGELEVQIIGDGTLDKYMTFSLPDPDRLVLDLRGVKSAVTKAKVLPSDPLVKKIRVANYPHKVRVVFDLVHSAEQSYQVVPAGDRLVVSFKPGESTPTPTATAQPSAVDSRDLRSASAIPSHSPASPGEARRYAYTDYRSEVRPTERNRQASGRSSLGEDEEENVELNFDNADVNEVIATIARLVGIRYIVDPGIQGRVTIHTAGAIAKEDLLSVFYLILEVNGLTAVKEGDFYRITTISDASRLPILLRFQTEGKPQVRKEEIVTQIIPLQYISVAEMSKLIEPFLSANATIIAHEGTNTLLVVDTGINTMKVVKLAEAFDIGLFEKMNHRFFFLKNADPEETVNFLKEVFAPTMEGRKDGVKFIPIKRLYAFLALSPDTRMFKRIEQLLLNLDATTEDIEPRIYVYFVKNGTALDLANLLGQVFADAITTGEGERPRSSLYPVVPRNRGISVTNPLVIGGQRRVATPPAQPPPQVKAPAETVKELTAESTGVKDVIKITPDEIRNALIIEATPADYRVIMNVLEEIDVLPRQVLIEATIAEIDYTLITQLGVTWEYLKGADFQTGLLNLTSSGEGLRFAIGISDELRVALQALEQENRANIISSPHVLASDNQEARIDVSTEVPIVSAETVVPSGGESIVTTTVQYRDTGVLLAVTPHINDRKLVTMDIYQEVSEQSADVVVAGEAYPSFFKRVVQTSLTVEHGQTIVLGGLIRENKSKASSGTPCLARLPFFGFLFGEVRDSFDKTELIILLTPQVIVSLDEVDTVTNGFKSKVDAVVRDMYEKRSIPISPMSGQDSGGGN